MNLLRFFVLVAALAASVAARPPNILVILADDLGYSDIGVHGSKVVPTPHLDALAASGVRCTNGYVSAPICAPSRAICNRSMFRVARPLTKVPLGRYFDL